MEFIFASGFFLMFMMFWATMFIAGILGTILWIWMLIECATNEPSEGNDKLIWIVILIFTHGLGGLLYYLIRRPERIRLYGK